MLSFAKSVPYTKAFELLASEEDNLLGLQTYKKPAFIRRAFAANDTALRFLVI